MAGSFIAEHDGRSTRACLAGANASGIMTPNAAALAARSLPTVHG